MLLLSMPKFSYRDVYILMDQFNNLSNDNIWLECAEHYIEHDEKAKEARFIGASIDSRNIKKNEIFFPFKGVNVDGYNFINQALYIADSFVVTDHLIKQLSIEKQIIVKSTHKALQILGKYMRHKIAGKVVAYTGSAGKTTTKMMLHHIISSLKKESFTSQQSYNTLLYGVPLSLINSPDNLFTCILEAGMSEPGTLDKISGLIEPDIAVITSIQRAHIGNFTDEKEIAYEKVQLLNYAKEIAVLPFCPYIKDMYDYAKDRGLKVFCFGELSDVSKDEYIKEGINADAYLIESKWNGKYNVAKVCIFDKEYILNIPYPSKSFIMAALANLLVCSYLGLNIEDCIQTLTSFKAVNGRGEIKKIKVLSKPMKIFDESYNANLDAMVYALKAFKEIQGENPVLILGQMNDLGDFSKDLHLSLYDHIKGYKKIILIGQEMKVLYEKLKSDMTDNQIFFASSLLDIFSYLHKQLPYYPTDTVFFIKGSRHGVNLDKVVEFLENYDKRV